MACHVHADCEQGFYCDNQIEWPYLSVCRPYREEGSECTEDYQCPITHYCWYASKTDKVANTKRCMEMYSRHKGTLFGWSGSNTLVDYTQNGKFCLSGLAFEVDEDEAQCTETNNIKFDGRETNAPYNCTATDPNKMCSIVYEEGTANEGSIDVFCRCSMSDSQSGFCESVIGTDEFAKAMEAKKLLYEKSECHTLDRENMRA